MKKKRIKPLVRIHLDNCGMFNDTQNTHAPQPNTTLLDKYASSYPAWVLKRNHKSHQDRVNDLIREERIEHNSEIIKLFQKVTINKSRLNILCLLSESNNEADFEHLKELLRVCDLNGIITVVHVILDGINCSNTSGIELLERLEDYIANFREVEIISLVGRFYAMDSDNHLARTEKAFHGIARLKGGLVDNFSKSLRDSYNNRLFDFELSPLVSKKKSELNYRIRSKDGVIIVNHEASGIRQLSDMIENKVFRNINNPSNPSIVNFSFYSMPPIVSSIFHDNEEDISLPKIIKNSGLKQIDVTDSCGVLEIPSDGQEQIIIKSSVHRNTHNNKVKIRDICRAVKKLIDINETHFVNVHFSIGTNQDTQDEFRIANTQIVEIHNEIEKIIEQVLKKDGIIILTMRVKQRCVYNANRSGIIHDQIPLVLIGSSFEGKNYNQIAPIDNDLSLIRPTYSTCSIEPLVLKLLNIAKPLNMSKESLI